MSSPVIDESPGLPRQRKFRPALLLVILPLVVIGLLIAGVGAKKGRREAARSSAGDQPEELVNVVTCRLQPTVIRDRLNLPAAVAPWVDLEVLAQVSDTVLEKTVSEGQPVNKDDVLARIDPRKYENAYQSARASLTSAEASLRRIRQLHNRNLASQSELDNLEATVENARAARDTAALDLVRCRITAPVDGLVNRVYIEEGQVLAAGQKVAQILKLDPVKVTAGIPESDVAAVRSLHTFTVVIDALGGRTFTGIKHFLSRTTETAARLYDLEIEVANPDGAILPDMFARVDIVKETVSDALTVPMYAITANNGDYIVYVEENRVMPLGGDPDQPVPGLLQPPDQTGRVRARKVTLGIREGFTVQVTTGLAAGEHVVIVGQKRVGDGQKVRVVRTVDDPARAVL